ncbi:acetyl-CoA carboxylase biotin carboxylase subunit family protein [Idiomarina sp. HP20-50]|uniref:ATP-grasp domain-containing protein n=1 Tax=Idiomarina sp. HP20-50 TaxID=3070813 RepID=UPI00294B62BF|nr:ATP-grasp domain-containing protein [Idiomarina sp. HP20-50]MDV6316243.1 ATP-grasp domain-containing protein [Idiomarina sp. HP20-50]
MSDCTDGILIIQRYNFLTEPTFRIGEWFKDNSDVSPLYLMTSCRPEHVDEKLYKEVHYLDTDPDSLIPVATQLLANHGITSIVTHYETDFIAAAKIRESFNVPGQSVQSAEAFRDKSIMKRLCQDAQIRVPKFKTFTTLGSLEATATSILEYFNLPVVVKPIDGLGSSATFLVYTESELKEGIRQSDDTFLVEELIEGDLFHVDGIVENNEVLFICASKYFGTTLNFLEGKAVGSHTLEQTSELAKRLKQFTYKVLSALPKPEKLTFHCEMFLTPANEMVFGEIASRPPRCFGSTSSQARLSIQY